MERDCGDILLVFFCCFLIVDAKLQTPPQLVYFIVSLKSMLVKEIYTVAIFFLSHLLAPHVAI